MNHEQLTALTLETIAPLLPPEWAQQFVERVNPAGDASCSTHAELGPCWRWTGATTRDGYAQLRTTSRIPAMIYREVYIALCGPIPNGHEADHVCRHGRQGCVRPSHIESVTGKENLKRMRRGLRKDKWARSVANWMRLRKGIYG